MPSRNIKIQYGNFNRAESGAIIPGAESGIVVRNGKSRLENCKFNFELNMQFVLWFSITNLIIIYTAYKEIILLYICIILDTIPVFIFGINELILKQY